jgi:multidrug resistance efflux pump
MTSFRTFAWVVLGVCAGGMALFCAWLRDERANRTERAAVAACLAVSTPEKCR